MGSVVRKSVFVFVHQNSFGREGAQTPPWQADLGVSQGLPAQSRRAAGTHPGLASSYSPDVLL